MSGSRMPRGARPLAWHPHLLVGEQRRLLGPLSAGTDDGHWARPPGRGFPHSRVPSIHRGTHGARPPSAQLQHGEPKAKRRRRPTECTAHGSTTTCRHRFDIGPLPMLVHTPFGLLPENWTVGGRSVLGCTYGQLAQLVRAPALQALNSSLLRLSASILFNNLGTLLFAQS